MENRLDGYQRLEQDFFRLCKIRKIKGETRTILIYLRGLYCYFGKPTFYYPDSNIMKDLGITKDTIQKAKKKLQERGIIEYKTGIGRGNATEYLMLKTELLPEIKGTKNSPFQPKKQPFYTSQFKHEKGRKTAPKSNIYSKEEKSKNNFFIPVDKNQMRKDVIALFNKIG